MDSTYLPIARLDDLVDDAPTHAAADGIDLRATGAGLLRHQRADPRPLGLIAHPAALAAVPGFLLALLVVRALPAVAFRRDLERRELVAVGLLQAATRPGSGVTALSLRGTSFRTPGG